MRRAGVALFGLALLLPAVSAQAALDTITLTRTGANTYSFSVSNNSVGTDRHYLGMYYVLVESSADVCDDSSLTYSTDSEYYQAFLNANSTFTRTITGNSGKYICITAVHGFPYTQAFSTPQGPLTYSGPTLTLNSAGADNEYVTGDHIEVTAAFGYNVTVTDTPRIALTVGSNTRYATYNSGSGTGNLVFRYTVVAADVDSDGISIAANALSLNSGTIQDSSNTNAVITHSALAASANHKVNPPVADTAPSFASNTSIADLSVIQNRPMRSVRFPQASGGDGKLSYSVTPTLPAGLSLDAATGLLSGTPTGTSAQATYTYTVSDSDTNTASSDKDTLSFKLEVLGEDTLRVHHEIEDGFLRKDGGRTFALDYIFNGPSTTAYTASSSDSAVVTATVSGSTLTVTGVAHGMATITVTATASGSSVNQSFELEVYGQNTTPTWSAVPDTYVERGKTVTIDLEDYASDPEGTMLAFSASSGNTNIATVAVSQTSILTITTPSVIIGSDTTDISVTASDGYYTASTKIKLWVDSNNTAPSFPSGTTIANQSLTQNVPMTTLSLPAASGGNGQLSYSLSPALPKGLVFDAEARTISGAPTATAASATYTYTVADTDNTTGSGDEASLTFTLAVAAKNTTPPRVTKVSYHTFDNAHDPSAASLTGPHPYGKWLIVRFTFDKAMKLTPGDTDDADARPAFIGVVDGKEGLRFRVVNRINEDAHEIPDQCGPFYPHLDSHTVFQCVISEPAWHLHGPGNLPKSNFQYTIRVLDDSEDLGGTAMAADHTPTAITIDPVGPTVTSAGYYSNAAATTAITGAVSADDDIYTKVVFSENMAHKAATDASARPHFSYHIGSAGTGTQFDVVATSETLDSGECKPTAAPPTNTYVCRYTVASGDTDSFNFVVAASETTTVLGGDDLVALTTDVAGNALNARMFHNQAGAQYSTGLSLSDGSLLDGLQLPGLKLASPQADTPPYQGGRTVVLESDLGSTTGCLDVQWGEAANGQNVQTWECNGTRAQEWTLEQRTGGAKQGSYRLVSGVGDGNTYCLDNRGDFHDGGRMGIWSCLDNDHRDVANQSVSLTSSHGGSVLTFSRNGAQTKLWAERTTTNPKGEVSQRTASGARAVWRLTNANAPRAALTLSVADAEATEAAGAALTFDVSLNRAPVRDDGTVSVDWATRDGTATAGADYSADSGTLTFGTGERAKTVRITVLDDAHDDDGETLELVLSNATGASIQDGTATGTIHNSDAMPQAWLGRFGRALSTQVLGGIRERREAARLPNEERVTLGGQALSFTGGTECGTFAAADLGGESMPFTSGAPDFEVRGQREAATFGNRALPLSGSAAASGAAMSGATTFNAAAGTSEEQALPTLGGAEAASLGAQPILLAGSSAATHATTSGEQALPMSGGADATGTATSDAVTPNTAACGTLAAAPGANAQADILSGADGWYAFDPHALNLHDGLDPYDRSMNQSGALSARDLLSGASFALTGEQDKAGGTLAGWGRVAESRFEGQEGRLTLDGALTTGLVGADYAREGWLAGMMLTWTDAKGDYRNETPASGQGKLDASLLAGTVYGSLQATERLELWGAAGHGQGELTLTLPTGPGAKTDMDWTMAAAGARGALLEPGTVGGLTLALVADALWTRTTSDETLGLAGAQADVTQLRLGLEGGWSLSLGGGELAPTVELGLRHDGGDAETGLGVELGGGLAWHHPGWGLSFDVQGRTLITHAEDGVTDRGLSASFAFDPAPLTALGPSLTLRHDYGGAATGGLAALFAPEALTTRSGTQATGTGRWAAEAAWGLPAFRERFTGSPHLGVGLQDTGRDLAVGWRLTPAGAHAPDLSFDVKAMRLERADATPDHGLEMNLEARW